MQTILLYFTIIVFWLVNVMNIQLTEVRGLSLTNVNFYVLIIFYGFMIIKNHRIIQPVSINKYIVLMIMIAIFSVFVKILYGELTKISLKNNILDVKNWANPFLYFFLFYNIIDDEKVCIRGLSALITLLIVTNVTMLLQTFGFISFEMIQDKSIATGRWAGFAEMNQYATFLVLLAPIPLSYFIFFKRRLIKSIALILFIFTVLGLFATGSRGGALSFLVAMATYGILLYKEKLIKLNYIFFTCFTILMICMISYLTMPYESKQLMTKRLDPKNYENIEEFSNGRVLFWINGIKIFAERPIIGHGHGTFVSLMEKRFNLTANSHNDYLSYLVHYGIVGLLVFILLLVNVFKYAHKSYKTTSDEYSKLIYGSYIAGFFGYITSMLFVNVMSPAIIFWIYTALVFKHSKLLLRNKNKKDIKILLEDSRISAF